MIDFRTVGDVWVAVLNGRFCLGTNSLAELRNVVEGQLAQPKGCRKFLLDFKRVGKVDDAAAGELEQMESKLSQRGGGIRFLNLTQSRVREPRILARLAFIARAYDDEPTAVCNF